MKAKFIYLGVVLAALSLTSCNFKPKVAAAKKIEVNEFFGQWTIDIKGGSVGWLEVRQEKGYIDADLLWGGGSVVPVANVYLHNNSLIVERGDKVIRTKNEKNEALRSHQVTNWLEVKRQGDKIVGYIYNPHRDGTGVDSTAFSGTKLPAPPPAPDLSKVKFGTPTTLFNGKDLSGWKLINDKQKNGFSVSNGLLSNDPVQVEGAHVSYGNLRTEQEFEDFNLKLEVNVPAGSNSGVYLRGMYEVQVVDSYKHELDPHNMGAVYSRITPTSAAEKPAGEWQSMDITLCDRHATVILNGVKIIDNQPIFGPTGGAMKSDVFTPGPIYLQGDHGKVSYRNLVLTPIVK
ncbi:MAG: DUF1080 domain-containing protein [Bacteroidia bacterium]|nr:DUF1080 domain-containing protein [Bacteroidia bacterium]